MADLSLFLEAPDRQWASHVESLVQQALGACGTVTMGVIGEGLEGGLEGSRCFVAGVVVCDEPTDRVLATITSALCDFDVDWRALDTGMTQIIVRPS